MELPKETDILIVGAGPVGAALANLCGRLGLRVVLVDKLPEVQTQPRALSLDNEALRMLQLLGLDEQSFARVVIPEVRLYSPIFGLFARMNTQARRDGHPMLITFHQPELEQAIHASLARYPQVRVLRHVEWVATTEHADGCAVQLRRADGSEFALRAQYVVGADGAGSAVRNALHIGFKGSTYQEDWLIVDALHVPLDIDHVYFRCDPRRPAPHMPAPGGRQRWEFMLHPGEDPDQMLRGESLQALLRPWVDAANITIERKAVYRFHARTASAFRAGRTLLVGDAAHVMPPFIGQGLVSGLRDVGNLAWKLAWVVQGRASDRVLDSYQTERRPHVRAITHLAQWMGILVMPRNRFAAFVSHGIARLMTLLPGVRSLIVDIKLKPKNRFKKGLFVPRGIHNRFEHGNHLPQGLWRHADGQQYLSDEVLGPQLQLVGVGLDPLARLTPAQQHAWHALGGTTLCICAPGRAFAGAWEDMDNTLGVDRFPQGWLIAVRPDKVVLTDGRPTDAGSIIDSVTQLMGA